MLRDRGLYLGLLAIVAANVLFLVLREPGSPLGVEVTLVPRHVNSALLGALFTYLWFKYRVEPDVLDVAIDQLEMDAALFEEGELRGRFVNELFELLGEEIGDPAKVAELQALAARRTGFELADGEDASSFDSADPPSAV